MVGAVALESRKKAVVNRQGVCGKGKTAASRAKR